MTRLVSGLRPVLRRKLQAEVARLRHVRLPDGSLRQLSQGMGCEGRLQKIGRSLNSDRPSFIFTEKLGISLWT
jgi:hypothetical protein